MGTRVQYAKGYVMARRWKRAPKWVPRDDTILLRIRGARGNRSRADIYLRPDEAVALIIVLSAEVWREVVP